jgi:hypothetical protein
LHAIQSFVALKEFRVQVRAYSVMLNREKKGEVLLAMFPFVVYGGRFVRLKVDGP